jgi:hypothetical protein
MQMASMPVVARRMAYLLCAVVAIDALVALVVPHPAVWCAVIPAFIPSLTPAILLFPDKRGRELGGEAHE